MLINELTQKKIWTSVFFGCEISHCCFFFLKKKKGNCFHKISIFEKKGGNKKKGGAINEQFWGSCYH